VHVELCFSEIRQEGVLMYGVCYHNTKENCRVRRDFRRSPYCIITGPVWK